MVELREGKLVQCAGHTHALLPPTARAQLLLHLSTHLPICPHLPTHHPDYPYPPPYLPTHLRSASRCSSTLSSSKNSLQGSGCVVGVGLGFRVWRGVLPVFTHTPVRSRGRQPCQDGGGAPRAAGRNRPPDACPAGSTVLRLHALGNTGLEHG